MRSQELFSHFSAGTALVAALMVSSVVATAQTLHVEDLANGTELILSTESLSSATTVAWPGADGEMRSITRG